MKPPAAKHINNQPWYISKELILLLVIGCVALLLLLANLGNQYLWQDEAQTALISKTILTDWVPRGYDGKNFFSQELGAEYGNNYIWRWHTWLPFYVLAGFYKVFGVSTFVSRLPFALFGFGTVVLIYFFAKVLWPGTRIPAIAAALLAVSVPFLLMCRQCRYYSMTMFFSVLSLYAYLAILQRKKYATLLFFAASTLLFHSQHIYVVVLFASVGVHCVIFRRDRLKILLVVIAVTISVNLPWLAWLSGMHYANPLTILLQPAALYFFIKEYLTNFFRYIFPLWLLAVLLIADITRRIRAGRYIALNRQLWEKITLPVFFIVFNIIAVTVTTPYPYFRYVAPSIPLLILLAAVIINAAAEAHLLLAAAAVVLLVATSQLKDFVYEITHDYNGPEEGIARYLNERGSPDDVVAITYGDMSLKFYTKMRVVGGLTGEDLEPAKNARWVVLRRHIICEKDGKVAKYLLDNMQWDKYRKIVLNYPDLPFENRESPGDHYFWTQTNAEPVVIFQKIE
jgi:4-amino-4-deoxy-L-arabinose transferase-like glycosyltransferase